MMKNQSKEPGMRQKKQARLVWLEIICLFMLLPLFLSVQNFSRAILYPILITACAYIIWRSFKLIDWKAFWHFPKSLSLWRNVFLRIFIVLILSCIAMFILPHQGWFSLPKYSLKLWLMVMIFYPLVSVLPQEIIWRFYLLEGTKYILPQRYMRIILSAFLFSFVHIIYFNAFSLIATFYLGFPLAFSYYQGKKSFWPVWVEHSLAGQIIFTIGLGVYFYSS